MAFKLAEAFVELSLDDSKLVAGLRGLERRLLGPRDSLSPLRAGLNPSPTSAEAEGEDGAARSVRSTASAPAPGAPITSTFRLADAFRELTAASSSLTDRFDRLAGVQEPDSPRSIAAPRNQESLGADARASLDFSFRPRDARPRDAQRDEAFSRRRRPVRELLSQAAEFVERRESRNPHSSDRAERADRGRRFASPPAFTRERLLENFARRAPERSAVSSLSGGSVEPSRASEAAEDRRLQTRQLDALLRLDDAVEQMLKLQQSRAAAGTAVFAPPG